MWRPLVPSVLACLVLPPTAGASTSPPPLPDYDMTRYCETLAVNSGRAWDRHVCLKKEQSARTDVEPAWRTLTAKVRETCDHYAVQAGGSYYILGACLSHYVGTSKGRAEQAADAARARP